jgi:CheY-specific phosphatase CheX
LAATEALVGERYDEVNDDVSELTNMIAGNAKANFKQLEMSLALPTVIVGSNLDLVRNVASYFNDPASGFALDE